MNQNEMIVKVLARSLGVDAEPKLGPKVPLNAEAIAAAKKRWQVMKRVHARVMRAKRDAQAAHEQFNAEFLAANPEIREDQNWHVFINDDPFADDPGPENTWHYRLQQEDEQPKQPEWARELAEAVERGEPMVMGRGGDA